MPPPAVKKPPKKTPEQIEAEKQAAAAAAEAERAALAAAQEAERRRAAEEMRVQREIEAARRKEELARIAQEVACENRSKTAVDINEHGIDDNEPSDSRINVDSDVELNTFLARVDEEIELGKRLQLDGGGATLLIPHGQTATSSSASFGARGSTRNMLAAPSLSSSFSAASLGASSGVHSRRTSVTGPGDFRPGSGGGLGPNPALVRGAHGEPSPLSKGLQMASRLDCIAAALERSLARAVEARDSAAVDRATQHLHHVRDLITQRLDALTWIMLQSASEYAVEMKDGSREVVVNDTYGPSASSRGDEGESTSSAALSDAAGEVLLWANLGPGKVSRLKTVQSGIPAGASLALARQQRRDSISTAAAALSSNASGDVPTLSVDLTKQVASLNAALRVTRTAYDHTIGVARLAAKQEAEIAAASEATTVGSTVAGAGAGTRPRSGVLQSSGGGAAKAAVAGRAPKSAGSNRIKAAVDVVIAVSPSPAGPSSGSDDSGEAGGKDHQPPRGLAGTDGGSSMVVGNVITVELLAMPEPPVTVGGMRLTLFSPVLSPPFTVQRLLHPAASQGVSAATQAIKVKAAAPASVIVPTNPVVARWQEDPSSVAGGGGSWVPDGISDTSYDARSRVLTFRTLRTTAHAMVQPRHTDLPYLNWSIKPIPSLLRQSGGVVRVFAATTASRAGVNQRLRGAEDGAVTPFAADATPQPTSSDAALLTVRTPRFTVAIAVEGHRCRLIEPDVSELRHLVEGPVATGTAALTSDDDDVWMSPGELLFALAKAGINLMPQVS